MSRFLPLNSAPRRALAAVVLLSLTGAALAQSASDLRTQFSDAMRSVEKSGWQQNPPAVGSLPTGQGQLPASAMTDPQQLSQKIRNPVGSDKTELLIFVSLEMPPAVIKTLAQQAHDLGGTLVLRGMKDGSVRDTKLAVIDIGAQNAPWVIQPALFQAFSVKAVPTFVLANSQSGQVADDGCAPQSSFVSVSGVQSIESALRTMARRGNDQSSRMAKEKMQAIGLRP